ncbi:MAG: sialidase family protein [Gemmatimonadota bacterium]
MFEHPRRPAAGTFSKSGTTPVTLTLPTTAVRRLRMSLPLVTLAALAAGCGSRGAEHDLASVGAITELSSPAGPGSRFPFLSLATDGRAYLSWLEVGADSTPALKFAILPPGAREWSPPMTVVRGKDLLLNWADFPSVVPLANGLTAAQWLVRDSRVRFAYGARVSVSADGGATWSRPATPHRDTTATEHGFVSLFAADSNVGAIWLDGREMAGPDSARGIMELRTALLTRDGQVGSETVVDSLVCTCCRTSIAATSSGPVVAYRDREPDELRNIAVARRVNGEWRGAGPVHDDGWRIPACPVNGAAIAARQDTVVTAWYTAPENRPRVQVAFSTDQGTTFGPPLRVDEGKPVGRVGVVLEPTGSALVSWIEGRPDGAVLRLRRVTPGGEMGPPMTLVPSSTGRAASFPQIALTANGLLVAWTEPGAEPRVRVARAELRRAATGDGTSRGR